MGTAQDDDHPAGAAPGRTEALSVLLRELIAAPAVPVRWRDLLSPGQVIGRFEMVRELGRGGFGVVYEARDRELGRSVAFKAVYPGTPERAGEQLLREAEAIARLSHPNLVTLFDAGRCELGPFLVLELLRGRTLRERLREGPLPVDEALRVACDVARGLAHAHAAGVLHRDLKPSNVFLCEDGGAKLLDFGMSHAFGRPRVRGGTPAYMAPEQWRDGPEDPRTDVFALGVLLFQLLSGKLPFEAAGPTLDDIPVPAEGAAPSGRAPPLDVPERPELGALVARMLELDPALRPRDAAEVLAALEALRAAPSPRARRRRAVAVALAALGAAGALAGAALGVAALRPPPPAPARPREASVAVLPLTTLSDSAEDAFFAAGVHGELIAQLTQLSGVKVIARGSVQRVTEGPGGRDLRAIAEALGVDTVVEGSVQRAGDRVRVAIQLVDARSGAELWGDRFDRKVADLFAIQTEIALEIAAALGAKLTPAERAAVALAPTRDREAHDLFLRGLYYWNRSMGLESDNRTAEELVAKAAARDPSFALAQAWLSTIAVQSRDDCEAGRAHAARAAALQPDLPQLHVALAQIADGCDHDARASIREYEAALRGAPGDAMARSALGSMRTLVGDAEGGLEDLRRAFALDPRSFYAAVELARELAYVRRFDEAARACRQARELEPGDVHATVLCALLPVWRDGDLNEARRALDALPRELPSSGVGAWALLQLLALFPADTLALQASGRLVEPFSVAPYVPLGFVVGSAHAARGEAAAARAEFGAAARLLEARLRRAGRPATGGATWQEALGRLFLARAWAGAGRDRDALREAERALAALQEPGRRVGALRFAAEIAAAAGDADRALALLDEVLSRPDGLVTPATLRVDPRYAPLRADPRFEALLAERAGAAHPR